MLAPAAPTQYSEISPRFSYCCRMQRAMAYVLTSTPFQRSLRHHLVSKMTTSAHRTALVDPAWIVAQQPHVSILDASWSMPSQKRDGNAEYLVERIPGARRFDIDAPGLADQHVDLPHMLPRAEDFGAAVTTLGVSNDFPVVIYAQKGFVGAARAWWMFRVFGKEDVFLLNGGLEAWKNEGREVETGLSNSDKDTSATSPFAVVENQQLVRSMQDMLTQIAKKEGVIIDARSRGRFDGTAPEPREGLLSGHMPGAFSLPSDQLTNTDGKLKSVSELQAVLAANGIDNDTIAKSPISLTCGSGVTAAIQCVALYELGIDAAVYDGSWSEYGRYKENPVLKR